MTTKSLNNFSFCHLTKLFQYRFYKNPLQSKKKKKRTRKNKQAKNKQTKPKQTNKKII